MQFDTSTFTDSIGAEFDKINSSSWLFYS